VIEGEPTLVDLGAIATVYGQLRKQERMILTAECSPGEKGHRFVIQKGPPDKLERFAEGGRLFWPVEGWAHVMDATRCTALAVSEFGQRTIDRIDVEAGGRVRLERDYSGPNVSAPKHAKSLAFWFHFVPMPVHVGAATSPQAMLAPLSVNFKNPGP
jgi:hypothetical protein